MLSYKTMALWRLGEGNPGVDYLIMWLLFWLLRRYARCRMSILRCHTRRWRCGGW